MGGTVYFAKHEGSGNGKESKKAFRDAWHHFQLYCMKSQITLREKVNYVRTRLHSKARSVHLGGSEMKSF